MTFFQLEMTQQPAPTQLRTTTDEAPVQENVNLTEQLRRTIASCFELCSGLLSTEAGKKLVVYAIVGTVVIGSGLIFGTAFKTASQVQLTNKSQNTLSLSYLSPVGTSTKCGTFLFPYQSCMSKFNGLSSNMKIHTYDGSGTLRIDTACKATLEDGPSDKTLTSNGNFFWICSVEYKDSSGSDAANVQPIEDHVGHLRGSFLNNEELAPSNVI